MSKLILDKFGKYLLLDHLVDGGMAKICRARYLGEQADKLVAIKMVQAQYSKDPSFVQMFRDELKVTFSLIHPNIAQMYDYGMVKGQLYSAMEYVDGKNLKEYLDRLKSQKFVFPVEISTYIVSQACQALHYAHTASDKLTGKKFNIIHRDISPHNIMLTYDGAVKVIDFGIAKADSNSEATQAGTIKGKLSYLAPEYLDGLELNHQYDQFAVAITLWEMLCSRKLFTAKNDLAVLKKIQQCKIPAPSSINPNVPKELDEIVLKALSKDRTNRFKDMDQFNRALVRFLYSKYPDFNASDLSYFAKELFKKEIQEDKIIFKEFGEVDITPYLNLSDEGSVPVEKRGKTVPAISTNEKGNTRNIVYEFKEDKNRTASLRLNSDTKQELNRNLTRQKKISNSTKTKKQRSTSTRRVNRNKTGTRTRTAIKQSNNSLLRFVVTFALILGGVFFFKDDILPDSQKIVSGKPGSRGLSSINKIKSEEKIILTFIGLDTDMDIYINNKKTELDGIKTSLKKGVYQVKVIKAGFKAYEVKDMKIGDDNDNTVRIPDLEKDSFGLLTTSLNFMNGTKLVFRHNGVDIEKTLPLKDARIPAGKFEAILVNSTLGTKKKIELVIEENKRNILNKKE